MKLVEMEKKHGVKSRWLPGDNTYKECDWYIRYNKNEQLLLQIWKAGQRRNFLLELKRKYAG